MTPEPADEDRPEPAEEDRPERKRKNMKKEKNMTWKRKVPVTHKDLSILALMDGVSSLEAALADHTDPVGVLAKVRATFTAHGKDTEDLDRMIKVWEERRAKGVKGRKPVKIGEERSYSVQQLSDGDLFLRLPLATMMGVSKGDKIKARFLDGQIIVSAE